MALTPGQETSGGAASFAALLAAPLVQRVSRSIVVVQNSDGAGAGTVWGSAGLVVTNRHVAPGKTAFIVIDDRPPLNARVVAADSDDDLALLRVDARLEPIELRREPLRAGEFVIALGHPWGERLSATAGVVFGPARLSPKGRPLVPVDIRLAPGNSGGPLVDARGRLAGINTMIAGGMGLAVPVDVVEAFTRQALAAEAAQSSGTGSFSRPRAAGWSWDARF